MSVTVTTKRYHKVKKERDDAQTKVDELAKELEQWQEKYENMEQERDAARMRQQELTKEHERIVEEWQTKYDRLESELQEARKRHPSVDEELRKLKGLSERETPLEAGSFKEEAGKSTPWLEGWKVKQLAALSMECLHQGQRSHDTRGSKASLVGLKAKPLEITVVNLSKITKLEMAANYFHSGKFESEPVGFIEPGESHTYNVCSRDGRSKSGVKGGIAFAVSNVEGIEEEEPEQTEEAGEPAKEENAAEEEKEQAEEKVDNKEEDTKNAENGEVVKENKELDEDKELEKFDPPNGEKKESEKKKKRFSLKREKKHRHDHSEKEKGEAPAEAKDDEPAADAAPEENATEETKEEAKEETKDEAAAEEEKKAESPSKDEADSAEKKPKKKAKFSLRKQKKAKDTPQAATKEDEKPAEEAQDQPDNTEPAAEETEEPEKEPEPENTEEAEEHEETPEVVGNGAFFVVAFENPLAGVQKAKSSKTQSKDVLPVLKKMKSGSPSKQPYGGHYKEGKRHFVYIWKDPKLGW